MKPGIYPDLPADEYHSTPAVSKSMLDLLARSPAHLRYSERKETPAMALGSAVHCAVLEPERFACEYATVPNNLDRRTKAGKAAWEKLQSSGLAVLSAADYVTCCRMRDSVHEHPAAREILSVGAAEQSAFWIDGATGVLCRARPDWVRPDGVIADLKTTDNASPWAFARSVAGYRYAVQEAMYRDGWDAAGGGDVEMFIFIAVEKTAPFAVAVYELDARAVSHGRDQYLAGLKQYRQCLDSGQWPAYSDLIETLTLPEWSYRND